MKGYSDGTFRPNRAMTRAELVTILARLDGGTASGAARFPDVGPRHWARKSIALAQERGWVEGYNDGTFRPGKSVTRAEAVTIINRFYNREADKSAINANPDLRFFPDVQRGSWYYYAVMEASIPHTAHRDTPEAKEQWLDPQQVTTKVKDGFYVFSGIIFVVENGSYVRTAKSGTDNFFEILLYISFFPQLIAGPIVKYHDVAPQLRQRTVTLQDAAQGCRRFIAGLGKKLLLADVLALTVDRIYAGSPFDGRLSLLAGVCYCMQIYFDFSGYSDMAIGMGRMFGFRFLENFDYPYRSTTIREFWRRWHISLSSWFKEYVYIPLGGSRRGLLRTCLNLMLVFLLTGLWHGAGWTFLLWGLWNGLLCVLERLPPLKKFSGKWYGHLYAPLLILLGFMVFRADSVTQGLRMVSAPVTGYSFSREGTLLLRELVNARSLLAVGVGLLLAAGIHLPLRKAMKRRPALDGAAYAGALCLLTLADQSEVTEAVTTEPQTTVPQETEPTEPVETDPPATEPPATEPPATEPPATEPPATEPPATEPPATQPPADPAQMLAMAQKLIGHPVSELYDAIGKPAGGSSYASSCNGPGEDGELYYTNYGFTVYTYREDGSEKVVDVWED